MVFCHSPCVCLMLSFPPAAGLTEFATHQVSVGWVLACPWAAAGGPVSKGEGSQHPPVWTVMPRGLVEGHGKHGPYGTAPEELESGDGVQPCHLPAAALHGGHSLSPGLWDEGEVERN